MLKSCGGEGNPPRFNEDTSSCDAYEVWTGDARRRLDEEDEICFSNICAGAAEFDDNGEAREVEENKYSVHIRSISCEGEYEESDPFGSCTGQLKRGAYDDYCYEDLVYNGYNTIDLAAARYEETKDCENSEIIQPGYNKVEGTQGQGIFVVDFHSDCDEEKCVQSCPMGQCVYPSE